MCMTGSLRCFWLSASYFRLRPAPVHRQLAERAHYKDASGVGTQAGADDKAAVSLRVTTEDASKVKHNFSPTETLVCSPAAFCCANELRQCSPFLYCDQVTACGHDRQ